jgi:membrane associated rhomboid family serine protease
MSYDRIARRDGLLGALIAAEPRLVLLHWDTALAVLLDAEQMKRLVIVSVPEGASAEQVHALLKPHVSSVQQGAPETHFVAVGGGFETDAALKQVAPFVQTARMGFHHFDDAGRLATITGSQLPLFSAAAARLGEGEVDPQILAAAATRGRALVEQERRAVGGLSGRYAVTAAVTAVCVLLYGLGWLWGDGDQLVSLWRMGMNNGAAVRAGEVYRLFASAFLHAGALHLIMNMFVLWSVGPLLEALLGPRRYVLLYGASALGGSLASALAADHRSVGASGAIFGLMGAMGALALRPNGLLPPTMIANMRGRVWTPIVINLVVSFKPGVDMLAHVGGGLVGFGLMFTVLTRGLVPVEQRLDPARAERAPGPLGALASALVGAAMVASVLIALLAGKPWKLGGSPDMARVPLGDSGITVEVPEEARVSTEESGGTKIYSVLSSGSMPVSFELIVLPLDSAPGPEDLEATLEQLRKDLDGASPPKWTRTTPARRATAGARPAVFTTFDADKGVKVRAYAVIEGASVVLVRGYARKDRPKAWEGIEEKVAASVARR